MSEVEHQQPETKIPANEHTTNGQPQLAVQQVEQNQSQFHESRAHSIFSQDSNPQHLVQHFRTYQPQSKIIAINSLHVSEKLKLKRYKNSVYYGEMWEGKRQGKGIMLYDNGRVYEGQWRQDGKGGNGFERLPNGCTYTGTYENNKPHGIGKYEWSNGEFYEGEWMEGNKHGSGMWRGVDGDSYIGQWRQGNAEGYGVHTWVNGDRYEGQFKNCLKHGEGLEKFANGDIYKGKYQMGKPHGFGQYYWANSSYFKGTFREGLRDGQGIWKKGIGNSDKYEGSYKLDKKQGYGIFTWATGNVYKGEFREDVRDGYGQMYWNDGSYYKGEWKNGIQHGEGEIYVPEQGWKKGVFENNVLAVIEQEGESVQNGIVIGKKQHAKKQFVRSRVSFRNRGKHNKIKVSHKTRSIDQGSVVRYGPGEKPLFNASKIENIEKMHAPINMYHHYPPTNKSKNSASTKTRLLHSSFYLHRKNNRASGSVEGNRTQQTSIKSEVHSQASRKKNILESINKGNQKVRI